MRDIDLAKTLLDSKQLTMVAVKDGQVIYESKDRGIKPLYGLVKRDPALIKDSSVADKVVGKGASLLYSLLGIKVLYTKLLSENAKVILEKNNIYYSADKECPYILNNSQTDYCPVEKMSLGISEPDQLIIGLEEFFKKLNQSKEDGENVRKKQG